MRLLRVASYATGSWRFGTRYACDSRAAVPRGHFLQEERPGDIVADVLELLVSAKLR